MTALRPLHRNIAFALTALIAWFLSSPDRTARGASLERSSAATATTKTATDIETNNDNDLRVRMLSLGIPVPGRVADCVLSYADTVNDLAYLTDEQLGKCDRRKDAVVKVAKLRELRNGLLREYSRRRRAEERAARRWNRLFATVVSTAENLVRGFLSGCGGSFLYETLIFSKDFYAATDDVLPTKVKNATLRAGVIGVFSAFTSVGAAMFVPKSVREAFSTFHGEGEF